MNSKSQTKLFLNLNLLENNDLDNFCDIVCLVPFLSDESYRYVVSKMGLHNEGLYTGLYFNGKDYISSAASLEDCDYSVIPFKYNPADDRVARIIQEAKAKNKTVLAFHYDDYEGELETANNVILFRASVGRSTIKKNERVFPAIVADHNFYTEDESNRPARSIGFCGLMYPFRQKFLDQLGLVCPHEYISRKNFFAAELPPKEARHSYYKILNNNKFSFCMRGAGNFSSRLYETLMMNRIPVLINTDTILPLESVIAWNNYIISYPDNDLNKIAANINSKSTWTPPNRLIWQKYFSALGFVRNLKLYIAEKPEKTKTF